MATDVSLETLKIEFLANVLSNSSDNISKIKKIGN
jgi:hypothetical protein